MIRVTHIVHSALSVALGCLCLYPAFVDTDPFLIAVAVFGAVAIMSAAACLAGWGIWWISSRVVGVVLILYALDVLIFGHGDDVGGIGPWLALVLLPLGFGVWSIALPAFTERAHAMAQPVSGANSHPPTP